MSVDPGQESDPFLETTIESVGADDLEEPDSDSGEDGEFESDDDDENPVLSEDSDGEDSDNDPDIFDWESFVPPDDGLAPWEKLGASYEAEAAIGVYHYSLREISI
jgi:hypothetical protein